MKRGVVVVLAVMAMTAFADAASGATFQPGDLLLQRDLYDPDETRWLRADGSFVSTLTARGHLAFDGKGRLYSVETHASRVFAYDVDGTLLGTHIEIPGTCVDASGLTFDAVGNAYVGEFGGCVGEPNSAGVRKFDPNGNFLGFPFTRAREADLLDLAADQCTLYAMSANDRNTFKSNVCTGEVSGFFGIGAAAPESHEVRVLPDGSVLLNYHAVIFRVSPEGTLVQVYEHPAQCDGEPFVWDPTDEDWNNENVFRGLALSVGGDTFWSSCRIGGAFVPLEIDVDTEQVVRSLGGETGYVSAVAGGFYAAHDHTAPSVEIRTPSDGAVYDFSGFFGPLDNRPTFNVLRAGKSVSVLFGLAGDQGLGIFEPGYPTSRRTSCNPAAPQDKVEETTTARADTLTYDFATGRYAYVFRTYHAWSNRCRELVLRFVDGTEQSVLFRLT